MYSYKTIYKRVKEDGTYETTCRKIKENEERNYADCGYGVATMKRKKFVKALELQSYSKSYQKLLLVLAGELAQDLAMYHENFDFDVSEEDIISAGETVLFVIEAYEARKSSIE